MLSLDLEIVWSFFVSKTEVDSHILATVNASGSVASTVSHLLGTNKRLEVSPDGFTSSSVVVALS